MAEQVPQKTTDKVATAPSPAAGSQQDIESHIRLALDLARQRPGYERVLTSSQKALQALQTAANLPPERRRSI